MRTNQHFRFQDLNIDQLWHLRQQVVLNSIFTSDYRNDFEFDPESICNFFDGYLDYLWELAKDDGYEGGNELNDIQFVCDNYDNPDNLFDYYWGLDGEYLCDIQYDPEWDEADDREYENYWNGVDPDGHDPDCR